ncbi:hypothetical protein [Grimontia sp. AD028]|uniref:hypothetical protein n=1 Tax=Grimontia sp. AD028 TaxID=1581149 RepID=UPI000B0EB1BC|nr:hypothetical protein [Grimontia sp. AD028]
MDINDAATRIDNLYLEVREEAAYQENLKQDILTLRQEIETKEDELRVQYAEELADAQSAADTASAAYDEAVAQKAVTEAAVQALVGESVITELLPDMADDFASQTGAIALSTESETAAQTALALIHQLKTTLEARLETEADVGIKADIAMALARLADIDAAVRQDEQASLTLAYTTASHTQTAATLLDVQMRLNNMEAQIARNAFIALGSVVNVETDPLAGQQDIEDIRTLDELNAALAVAQTEYGAAQTAAYEAQTAFQTYLAGGHGLETKINVATNPVKPHLYMHAGDAWPELRTLFDADTFVYGFGEQFERVYASLLPEDTEVNPSYVLRAELLSNLELIDVELEGALQSSSLNTMLNDLQAHKATFEVMLEALSKVADHFWALDDASDIWAARHPAGSAPAYTLEEALAATKTQAETSSETIKQNILTLLETLSAYEAQLTTTLNAATALEAADADVSELQSLIAVREESEATEALTLSLRQVSAELQVLSVQIRDQQARLAADPDNTSLLDGLAALVSEQNARLTEQAELLVQLQTYNAHEVLVASAASEADTASASIMTAAQWDEAVAVAHQAYLDALETENDNNYRLSLSYFGEYAQPGILQDIEALPASYLPALNFDEAQQYLITAQTTLDVADPQELYSYRQEAAAIKAEMDLVGNISSQAHSGVGLSGDIGRYIGAVFPYYRSQNYGYLHGYISHYSSHLNGRISSVVNIDSFSGDVSRLNTLKGQVEWSDSDVAEAIALTESVMADYSLINIELSTLADDFLTLEEAQSLRENNLGNTYQGLDAVDFPSMEEYSTQEILDEILAAVETNSQGSRSTVSRQISDIQSLQQFFQSLSEARQRAKLYSLFGEKADLTTFQGTYDHYLRRGSDSVNTADAPLIGELFPYWKHQYYGMLYGYDHHFGKRFDELVQPHVNKAAFGENSQILDTFLGQSDWDDNDIAKILSVAKQWSSDLTAIDNVLSTLPENFLTLEEAESLRESNPGNTYTGTYSPVDLPSADEYTTQALLDATLERVRTDAESKRNEIAQRLTAVESIEAYFEALAQDRQRSRLQSLFGEAGSFDDFSAHYEQVLIGLSPDAVPTNMGALTEALTQHISLLPNTAGLSTENAELVRYREDNAAFINTLSQLKAAILVVPEHFMTLEEAEILWQQRNQEIDPDTGDIRYEAMHSAEEGLAAAREQAETAGAAYLAKLDDTLTSLQSVQDAINNALLVEDALTHLNTLEADAYLAKTQLTTAVALDTLTTQRAGLDVAISSELAALDSHFSSDQVETELEWHSQMSNYHPFPTYGTSETYDYFCTPEQKEALRILHYHAASYNAGHYYTIRNSVKSTLNIPDSSYYWESFNDMYFYAGDLQRLRQSGVNESSVTELAGRAAHWENALTQIDAREHAINSRLENKMTLSHATSIWNTRYPDGIDPATGLPPQYTAEEAFAIVDALTTEIATDQLTRLTSVRDSVALIGSKANVIANLINERDRSDYALAGLQARVEEEARTLAQAELQAMSNSTLTELQALAASIEAVESQLAEDPSNPTLQDKLTLLIHQQQALLAQQQSTLTALTGDDSLGLLVTNSLRNLDEATATREKAAEDVEVNKQQVADLKQEVALLSEEIGAQLTAMADKRAEYEALEEEAARLRLQESALRETLADEEVMQADALAVEAAKVGALTSLYTQKTILTSSQVDREAIEVDNQTIIRNASHLISANEAVLTQHAQDITNKETELFEANKALKRANENLSKAKGAVLGIFNRPKNRALYIPAYIGWDSATEFGAGAFSMLPYDGNKISSASVDFRTALDRKASRVDLSSEGNFRRLMRSILDVINQPTITSTKIEQIEGQMALLDHLYRTVNGMDRRRDGPLLRNYTFSDRDGNHSCPSFYELERRRDNWYDDAKNQIKTWASRAINGLKTIRTTLNAYKKAYEDVGRAQTKITGIENWLNPYRTMQNEIDTAEQQITAAQLALDTAQAAISDGEAALARVNVDIAEAEAALADSVASRKEAEASVNTTRALLAQAETDKANAEALVLAARQEINVAGGHYNEAQASLLDASTELGSAQDNLNVAMSLHLQAEQFIHDAEMAKLNASQTLSDAEQLVQFSQYLVKRQVNAEVASNDTSYEYDDRGQLIGEVSALVSYSERTEQGGLTQYIGRLRTEHQYDSLGNVIGTVTAKGTADEAANTFVYDVNGNQTQSHGIAGSTVVFDAIHQATININAQGHRRDKVYDDLGRLRFDVDELGYVTEHRYNGLGQKASEVRYSAAYAGARVNDTPLTLDALTTFAADAGAQRALDYRYDLRGQLRATVERSTVDNLQRETERSLNAFGETVAVTQRYQDGDVLTTVTTQAHLYSVAGQLLASRNAAGDVTLYGYNGYGELKTQRELTAPYHGEWTLDALNSWRQTVDTTERHQSYVYDNRGNRQQTTLHNVTYHRHNGTLVEEVTHDLITTTYHDHAGRMYITVTEEGTTNPETHYTAADRTLYEYDALGRLVASWGKAREYLVDGLELGFKGDLPKRLIANQRTDYFYDAQGNQLATRVDGPVGRVTQQYFDDEGRLIGRRDAEGHYTAITTDAMNRVTSERTAVSGNGYQHTREVTYHYDATGRQRGTTVSVNNADDIIETVIYNAYGEVEEKHHNGKVQESYVYDGLGRVTHNTVKGVTTGYRYNWLDKVTAETVEGTRTTTRDYDPLGNVTRETGPAQDVNAATPLRSVVTLTHDRWGNVLTQTVNGHNHTFMYNHANQVIKQVGPAVEVIRADGSSVTKRPVTLMYYDHQGNRLAVQDANGQWQKSYYDLTGQKLMDVNGADGVTHYYHNAYGDEIARVNAAGQGEVFTYDNNGQLLTRAKVSQSKGYLEVYAKYAYDQAGQRYHEQWQGASGYEIFTRYDAAGRVLETQGGGQHKRYTYDSFGNRKTESWLQTGAVKATKTSYYDVHGRLTTQTLYDGTSVTYGYDAFGQLKTKSGAISQSYEYWDNGLLKRQTTGSKSESYTYDVNGRERNRTLTDTGHKLVTVTDWDAQGRIQRVTASEIQQTEAIDEYERVWTTHYDEDGDAYRTWEDVKKPDVVHTLTGSSVQYYYDAVGNRRKVVTTGEQSGTRWYHYDGDNRMVGSHTRSSDVALSSIQGRAGDRRITYNALGQKVTEQSWDVEQREVEFTANGYNPWQGFYTYQDTQTLSETVKNETQLSYDNNGHIAGVSEYEYVNGTRYNTRTLSQTNSLSGHAERSTEVTRTYTYSRENIDTSPTVATLKSSKTTTSSMLYSKDGQLYNQVMNTTGESEISVWMDYHYSGQLAAQRTFLTVDGKAVVDTHSYAYQGRENFQKKTVEATTTRRAYGKNFTPGTSTFHYNSAGHLEKVTSTKADSERQVLTDFNGQIALQVAGGTLTAELSTGGNPLAHIGTGSVDADLLSDSGSSAGQQPGTYTVATNDTLQRIAQMVYGDSRYWYLIADANGLSPTEPLTEGKLLVIPNQHTQTFNGAESFKPYNESEVLGNVNPDPIAPPPPKKSCNPIAQIVMVVVAVVVAYYTGYYVGVELGASTAVAGAAGAAAGSAASQLVGMALGEVDSFSWKQVALSAVAGAATAGVNSSSLAGTKEILTNSAASYGANYLGSKVLGQDVSFSWKNLAASVVGSLVGSKVGGETGYLSQMGLENTYAIDYLSGFASSSTASVLRGESFSDNAGMMAVDSFGNVLGRAVVDHVKLQNVRNSLTASTNASFSRQAYEKYISDSYGVFVPPGSEADFISYSDWAAYEESRLLDGNISLDDSDLSVDEPQAFVNTEVLDQQADGIFDPYIKSDYVSPYDVYLSESSYKQSNFFGSMNGWLNDHRSAISDFYDDGVGQLFFVQATVAGGVFGAAESITGGLSRFWDDPLGYGSAIWDATKSFVSDSWDATYNWDSDAQSRMYERGEALADGVYGYFSDMWTNGSSGNFFAFGETVGPVAFDFAFGLKGAGYASKLTSGWGNDVAPTINQRHLDYGGDLGAINESVELLGQRALRNSGGDPYKAEAIFEDYLKAVDNRLQRVDSDYRIEIQPAALKGEGRVPAFIYLHRGGPDTSLITNSSGDPKLFAYPGSKRLDAGVIDISSDANQFNLHPVVSGFDITTSKTKPNIVNKYQQVFGDIPIYDIRLD